MFTTLDVSALEILLYIALKWVKCTKVHHELLQAQQKDSFIFRTTRSNAR